MSVEVTLKTEKAQKLFKRLKEIKTHSLTIGFQGPDGAKLYPNASINVATVALLNEFGTINMPARPFMRTALFEGRQKIANEAAKVYGKMVDGRLEPVDASSQLANFVAGLIVKRIDDSPSWAAALAKSTIQRKGSSKPLVDTELMRNSVTWAVRKNGSIIAKGKP